MVGWLPRCLHAVDGAFTGQYFDCNFRRRFVLGIRTKPTSCIKVWTATLDKRNEVSARNYLNVILEVTLA